MVTQQQAKDMRDAIRQLEASELAAIQTQRDADIAIAMTWWNTVKPSMPTTRQEALDAFNFIKGLIETETDRFRLHVLKKKLEEANEKFKEIKANG